MPLSRFLAIALIIFPLTAYGQIKQNDTASTTQQTATTTAPEPWRILPNDLSKIGSLPSGDSIVLQPNDFIASSGGTLGDSYCLKIRSYVVARDSKDSESTHPVHYSTCQPASRYRVKSIELQAQPQSR